MKFKEELATKTAQTETVIEQFLPKEEGFAARLAEAMNYSMRAGGKHLRPIFLKKRMCALAARTGCANPLWRQLR